MCGGARSGAGAVGEPDCPRSVTSRGRNQQPRAPNGVHGAEGIGKPVRIPPPPLGMSLDAAGACPGGRRLPRPLPGRVTRCSRESVPHRLRDARVFFCPLQGALHSVFFLAGSLRLPQASAGSQMGKLRRPGRPRSRRNSQFFPPPRSHYLFPWASMDPNSLAPTAQVSPAARAPGGCTSARASSRAEVGCRTEDTGSASAGTSPAHTDRWGGFGQCRHTHAHTHTCTHRG